MRRFRFAFTVLELLITLAIIAVLTALILPMFAAARRSAKLTSCSSNLHQVALALRMYQSDYGALPSYSTLRNVHPEVLLAAYSRNRPIFHCPAAWDRITGGRYDFQVLPINGTPVLNAAGVIASCDQHLDNDGTTVQFGSGTWVVVHGDASAARIAAEKVERWVLTGGAWYREGTQPNQLQPGDWVAYRFPGEPWPPQYE